MNIEIPLLKDYYLKNRKSSGEIKYRYGLISNKNEKKRKKNSKNTIKKDIINKNDKSHDKKRSIGQV